MNVERLNTIARELKVELDSTQTVARLQGILSNLQNIVSSPGQPQFQQELSRLLTELRDALSGSLSNAFPPSWRQTMEELGISNEFGDALLGTVATVIENNQLTPSVAVEELTPLLAELSATETNLKAMVEAFDFFHIGTEGLQPGEAEVSVMIPRRAVDSDLPGLGRELVRIQQLLGPFLELTTHARPDLKVRTIASSDFSVYVDMAPVTAAAVAAALKYLIDSYKTILEIRLLRNQLKDVEIPDQILEQVQEHVDQRMSTAIEEYVDQLVDGESRNGREHELRTELQFALNGLANRIDAGYHLDVRVGPDPDEQDSEDQTDGNHDAERVAVEQIRNSATVLQFIQPSGDRILSLPEGPTRNRSAADASTGPHES